MELKNILYTGVMISTFSPGVVSFRTVDDMAGTKKKQKISGCRTIMQERTEKN